MSGVYLTVAVVVILVAANLATNRVNERYYVPLAVLFALGFAAIGLGFGLDLDDLGLGHDTLLPGLGWACALVGAVAAVYLAGALLPRTRPLFGDRRATEARGREIARRALVDVPFGTVLLEEVAFRGVLLGMLDARWGTVWAVAGTSALFGLWHVLPALPMHESNEAVGARLGRWTAVALTVAGTALAGAGFAALRWWTGSLLPPIGLHWALNGLGLAVAWGLSRAMARSAGALEAQVEDRVEAQVEAQVEDRVEDRVDAAGEAAEEARGPRGPRGHDGDSGVQPGAPRTDR